MTSDRVAASAAGSTLEALRGGRLSGARELRLGGLGLTEVPDEIFGLADTLRILDLGGNRLTRLPHEFACLRQLEVLFASGNPIERLPPILGDCPALSQLGFRGCGLREIPAEALPAQLRWLTLTDNELEVLPRVLGERPRLQKLMLAGNRLRDLPESLRDARNLELIRLSANRVDKLPQWLAEMPRLAWLAWSGNPLDAPIDRPSVRAISWADLELGALLGQGASGSVHAAAWRCGGNDIRVAVKLFKGFMTSDGSPDHEMSACLAAGVHPHLMGGHGRVCGHPKGTEGLVMPLLPPQWRVLAEPPSLASCSRDVYDPSSHFDADVALRLAAGIARAGAHLHAGGLLHGDLYAHNILWDGDVGEVVLSDFGAASFMPAGSRSEFESFDVLAFGLLLGELLDRSEGAPSAATDLHRACTTPDASARPRFDDVVDALQR